MKEQWSFVMSQRAPISLPPSCSVCFVPLQPVEAPVLAGRWKPSIFQSFFIFQFANFPNVGNLISKSLRLLFCNRSVERRGQWRTNQRRRFYSSTGCKVKIQSEVLYGSQNIYSLSSVAAGCASAQTTKLQTQTKHTPEIRLLKVQVTFDVMSCVLELFPPGLCKQQRSGSVSETGRSRIRAGGPLSAPPPPLKHHKVIKKRNRSVSLHRVCPGHILQLTLVTMAKRPLGVLAKRPFLFLPVVGWSCTHETDWTKVDLLTEKV